MCEEERSQRETRIARIASVVVSASVVRVLLSGVLKLTACHRLSFASKGRPKDRGRLVSVSSLKSLYVPWLLYTLLSFIVHLLRHSFPNSTLSFASFDDIIACFLSFLLPLSQRVKR